jgi:hypothetical protein
MLCNLQGPVIYSRDLILIAVWNGVFALGGTSKKAQGFYIITMMPQIPKKLSRFSQKWRGESLIFNHFIAFPNLIELFQNWPWKIQRPRPSFGEQSVEFSFHP